MEDDSNSGKGDKKIGSSSNPESSPTKTNSAGVAGQENVPFPIVSSSWSVGESSSGSGYVSLRDFLLSMRLPHGYGKGQKRTINSVYPACSSDINPSSLTRRRLSDGSLLEVERRPPPAPDRMLQSYPTIHNSWHERFGPLAASIQLSTTVGMSEPTFERQHCPSPNRPGPMSPIYEDADAATAPTPTPTSSSNDEMLDVDSDNMPGSH